MREDHCTPKFRADLVISIHFPRMREDCRLMTIHSQKTHFNPLPSNEGRPVRMISSFLTGVFQSTSLEWGKTQGCDIRIMTEEFQSTSLEWGKTWAAWSKPWIPPFQSTSLEWGKTCRSQYNTLSLDPFQSTSLEWGKTVQPLFGQAVGRISIHFPRMREDLSLSRS